MTALRSRLRLPRPEVGDLFAGATVAVVLVPQSLAYASLAGLPPERGLFAALLPVVVGGLLASSRYLQTGPTAITSLLTFGAVSTLAPPGSDAYIGLVMVLALLVGIVRMGIGLLGLGGIAHVMSPTVVTGFVAAAALLIIASQLPAALGVSAGHANPLLGAVETLAEPGAWSVAATAIAAVALAIVLVARRIHPLVPGALLAVAAMAGISAAIGFDGRVIGPIGLPQPFAGATAPLEQVPALVVPAVVIALLGFAEPAAIARRYAAADREAWDPGREFVSQGAANLASGLSGGFPVGGSFSRTALARLAGARTRWAFVATTVGVAVLIPGLSLVAALPTAVLAAIVIAAVAGLIDHRPFVFYWRAARLQLGVALVTFIATLATAPRIELGVMVGVAAAIAVHLVRESRIHAEAWVEGMVLHLRPSGVLYFASAPKLEELLLERVSQHPAAEEVAIHLDRLGRVDVGGAMVLRDLLADFEEAGFSVRLLEVPEQTRRIASRVLGSYLTEKPSHAAVPSPTVRRPAPQPRLIPGSHDGN